MLQLQNTRIDLVSDIRTTVVTYDVSDRTFINRTLWDQGSGHLDANVDPSLAPQSESWVADAFAGRYTFSNIQV